jgi:membrane protease YdiL (CAAX protease family)
VILFFVLAFAITWGLQAPALVSATPDKWMALVGLGAFGPMFAAMIASGDIRGLFRPMKIWRVGLKWYVAALFVPGGIFVVAAALYNVLGGHGEPLLYGPTNAAFVAAAICFPIGEEVGWRGFALPSLRKRFGPLAASVIIGVFWTLWHIPMMAMQHVSPVLYVVFFPFMICGSIFFTWIWEHTNRSLLLAVLAHVGAHLNNSGHALPARALPIVIHTIAYVVLAVALVMFDRKLRARQ